MQKNLIQFYYSSTLVFLGKIGAVKLLWASTPCIFLMHNLSITSVTKTRMVVLDYYSFTAVYFCRFLAGYALSNDKFSLGDSLAKDKTT